MGRTVRGVELLQLFIGPHERFLGQSRASCSRTRHSQHEIVDRLLVPFHEQSIRIDIARRGFHAQGFLRQKPFFIFFPLKSVPNSRNPSNKVYGADRLLVTAGSIRSTEFFLPKPSSSWMRASGSQAHPFYQSRTHIGTFRSKIQLNQPLIPFPLQTVGFRRPSVEYRRLNIQNHDAR